MKSSNKLFAALIIVVMSSTSFGMTNRYLSLTGQTQGVINGSATPVGYEGLIDVVKIKHEVLAPRDISTGKPTDKSHHEPFTITKYHDKSSPLLLSALVNNELLTDFQLFCIRPVDDGSTEIYYTVILHNARICRIQQETVQTNSSDIEKVSFTYDRIEWNWKNGEIVAKGIWEYNPPNLVISDLNNDGIVNIMDLAIFANEWLAGAETK